MDHKRAVKCDIISMCKIISYLDYENSSIYFLTKIIISFGHFKNIKTILEKYYTDLPIHKYITGALDIKHDYIISGSYLLYIMGLVKEHNDIDIFCNVDPLEYKYIKSRSEEFGYEKKTPGHVLNYTSNNIRYIKNTRQYYDELGSERNIQFIIVKMDDLYKYIKEFDFDLCTNILEFKYNKFKFTFGTSVSKLLSKVITINRSLNVKRNVTNTRRIIKYMKHGFEFIDKDILLELEKMGFKVIKIDEECLNNFNNYRGILLDQMLKIFEDDYNIFKKELKELKDRKDRKDGKERKYLRYHQFPVDRLLNDMKESKLFTNKVIECAKTNGYVRLGSNNYYDFVYICNTGVRGFRVYRNADYDTSRKYLKNIHRLELTSLLVMDKTAIKINIFGTDIIFTSDKIHTSQFKNVSSD
jgi:hypothetical protein